MSIPEAEDNNQPLEPDDIQEKKKEIFEAIADVTNWYRDHRLHLPDSLTKEVGEITDKVVVLGAVSINLLERPEELTESRYLDMLKKESAFSNNSILETVSKEKRPDKFAMLVSVELFTLSEKLEKIYKSVTEAK